MTEYPYTCAKCGLPYKDEEMRDGHQEAPHAGDGGE